MLVEVVKFFKLLYVFVFSLWNDGFLVIFFKSRLVLMMIYDMDVVDGFD